MRFTQDQLREIAKNNRVEWRPVPQTQETDVKNKKITWVTQVFKNMKKRGVFIRITWPHDPYFPPKCGLTFEIVQPRRVLIEKEVYISLKELETRPMWKL